MYLLTSGKLAINTVAPESCIWLSQLVEVGLEYHGIEICLHEVVHTDESADEIGL
jgi:hypothetical protein